MPRKPFTEHDFWVRIDYLSSDCWNWKGRQDKDGYGLFKMAGKTYRAHRLVWELTHGPIPDGLFVLHKNKCHNPSCVNPDHLYLGTPKDNVQDAIEIGTHAGLLPPSELNIARIKETWSGRKHTPEARAKMAAARKGTKASPATKEKMSLAQKKRQERERRERRWRK